MQLDCPHCGKRLVFSDEPPNFCGFCGKPLRPGSSAAALALAEAPTVPPRALPESQVDLHAQDTTWLRGAPGADLPADEPTAVGNYRLLRRLGGGGMGAVYEAEDLRSSQRVALKLISRDFVGHPEALKRFRQEGRLASQLSHPRCVFVLAVSEEQGRPCIVMELMTGQTLTEVVANRGPLDYRQAVTMIVDVMDGLIEAHRLGLVHRDVKPSNCFLESNGRVKIGDFGLAKSLLPASASEQAALTKTGAFIGTPLFASPEQIKGEKVDQQADVYSVAATLYFLLCGKAPFEGSGDAMAVMARIVADDPPPLRDRQPQIPVELEEVVLKGLARDRKQRWASMADMRQALAPFLPRRRSYVGLGLRQAAYLIDLGLLAVATLLILELMDHLFALPADGSLPYDLYMIGVSYLFHLVYFTAMERRWGASIGKWLMRLRVHQMTSGLPPTWGQALRRTLVFLVCFAVIEIPLLCALPRVDPQEVRTEKQRQEDLLWHHSQRNLISLGSFLGGVILISLTMRRRNNSRGVHEFASGTQVVRLPGAWFARPVAVPVKCSEWQVTQPAGMPSQVDRYQVLGALRWEENQQVLTASDPTLERAVWVWRRRRDQGSLCTMRRATSRPTRWRWLAGGQENEEWCWDAFLSRPGISLPQMAAELGARPWSEARPIIRQLADELTAALAEETVPPRLGPDQVWLDEQCRVHLLDIPLGTATAATDAKARALDLLQRVAVLLLEGRERTGPLHAPLRVALPVHAERLMTKLMLAQPRTFELAAWAEALHETDDAPAEVTRALRVMHVLGTGLLLIVEASLALGLILPLMALLPSEAERRSLESWLGQFVYAGLLVVNVALSWLTRGGMRLRLLKLALRTEEGQAPSRWRAAGKTLLAGLPVVVLGIIASRRLDSGFNLSLVLNILLALLMLSYLILPLIWPKRTWYERLSRTVLVPQ
jgi:uncharacterized RDD family membrane protein YckC